jgi:hypothetical protein
MDINSFDQIKSLIARRKERLIQTITYSVDTVDQLMYIRGQIKSLDDLQQDIKDLLEKQEQRYDRVHGDTEGD